MQRLFDEEFVNKDGTVSPSHIKRKPGMWFIRQKKVHQVDQRPNALYKKR